MEEKEIISGNLGNVKRIRNVIFLIGLILSVIWWGYTYTIYSDYAVRGVLEDWMVSTISAYSILGLAALLVFIIIGSIVYAYFSKMEITVTSKRVYGCAAFGKRVDLPLDSISAIGSSALKGIAVATSASTIKFYMLQNRDEIHNVISQIVLERQNKQNTQTTIKQKISLSNADELKKFKELLDSGVISQEEFETKKKQLLGL